MILFKGDFKLVFNLLELKYQKLIFKDATQGTPEKVITLQLNTSVNTSKIPWLLISFFKQKC